MHLLRPTGCTPPGVNGKLGTLHDDDGAVNAGSSVVSMSPRVGDVDNGGGCACVGAGGI